MGIRKEVRDGLVAALAGLATTGANVFASRVRPFKPGELPALNVIGGDEELERGDISTELADRRMRPVVEATVARVDGYDDELDQVIEEVEAAIGANSTLGGACADAFVASISVEFSADGDRPVALATITLDVLCYAALGA